MWPSTRTHSRPIPSQNIPFCLRLSYSDRCDWNSRRLVAGRSGGCVECFGRIKNHQNRTQSSEFDGRADVKYYLNILLNF